MHKIDGAGATADKKFTQGNPAASQPATTVTADWLNAVQEEVVAAIEGDGEVLDKNSNNQLRGVLGKRLPDIGSYALLRAYSGPLTAFYVRGVATLFDGGYGVFRVDASDTTSVDNGVTILVDAAERRWVREDSGDVDARWAGTDGTTDDAAGLAAAVAVCKTFGRRLRGAGPFRVESTVSFREIEVDFSAATIDVAHAGVGILIGGNASNGNNPTQRFGTVTRSVGADSATTPTVRAIGVKGQHIYLNYTTYFQVYADTHSVGEQALRNLDYSSAYSSFWIKFATTIELTNNPANASGPVNSDPGGATQWITENQFYLNRTTNILINGTYEHNHNKFYNGTLEGSATINIDTGRDNKLVGMRFEAGPTTITFGARSSNNLVLNTWDEGNSEVGLPIRVGSVVNDAGVSNLVVDDMAFHYTSELVAAADVSDVVLSSVVGAVSARAPELQRVAGLSGNPILVSEILPVQKNSIFTFVARFSDVGDDVKYRCALKFFDKNLKPINASVSWVASPIMTTASSNEITQGLGSDFNWEVLDPAEYAVILQAAVTAGAVFVQAVIKASNTQLAAAKARRLEITYSTPGNAEQRMGGKPRYNTGYVVSAAPTKGFAPVGFQAVKSDGTAIYLCGFSLDTSSTAGAVLGAASISVESATGVTIGDIIGVNLDTRDTHWTTVSSVAGTTIGLTVGLAAAAASGARVVFNRWATK